MKRSRVEFTKPMKKTHTILIPSMLDFHFPLLKYAFLSGGYKCDVIGVNEYSRSQMINAGWEYSNNDVCFPCNLIIGQFICALKSGKYDTAKTALLLPQTGGGCRACNYIMLLRKALLKAGLQNVPVVSLNVSGVEKHSGFSITPKMVLTACAAIYYSDWSGPVPSAPQRGSSPGQTGAACWGGCRCWGQRSCGPLHILKDVRRRAWACPPCKKHFAVIS